MAWDIILFDLDGTLTDPGVGITSSVQYALKAYGIEVSDRTSLNCFIGPPLTESFTKYFGFSDADAVSAVDKYREYYQVRGIFENFTYGGIEEMLRELKRLHKTVVMATSKPECFAKQIAEHFNIEHYFDCITGSKLDGRRVDKAEVIECALERIGQPDRSRCVMVGDRMHDMIGAKKAGLEKIGVLYGYGTREELSDCGADLIAESVEELRRILTE